MQTRSQTKDWLAQELQEHEKKQLIKNTKEWRDFIRHHLDLIHRVIPKIEKIALVIKMYKQINEIVEDETVFIKVNSFSIFSIVVFMKIFELRTEIQHRPYANATEQNIGRQALQILNTVEKKLRVLLKKITNIRELAISRGICADKLEQLLA
jgi:hypothetical protein